MNSRFRYVIIALFSLVVVASPVILAQQDRDEGSHTGAPLETIGVVLSPFWDAHKTLIVIEEAARNADTRQLRELALSSDDRIATYAAYEQSRRAISSDGSLDATSSAIARFTGFIEGRQRITVPTWWSEELRSVDRNPQREMFPVSGTMLRCDVDNVQISQEVLQFEWKGETLRVPQLGGWLQRSQGEIESFSLVVEAGYCILATYSVRGAKIVIRCVSSDTGRQLWRTELLGGCPHMSPGFEVVRRHWVELCILDSRIVVFGCDVDLRYFEIMNLRGTSVMQFYSYCSWRD